MSDVATAERIIADQIAILVDLNGHTKDARTTLCAMRPAPIIVNWLGFPGTMGSSFHHYIIADEFIIPPENEKFYSETVVRLPCYQPTDRKRPVAADKPNRSQAGLPEQAMVYCCFNETRKMSQFTWQRWIRILQRVPNSVLWLLDPVETTKQRMWSLLAAAELGPERLVFAGREPNPRHLARYPLADLFLDTAPYGAHTTANDALWMGVPMLTWPGRSFASRVCGSLLTAVGTPELICHGADDFVEKAVHLGTHADDLRTLRTKIASARDTAVLFDTPRLVSALEDVYRAMVNDFRNGRLPRPDLSNLDLYNEIGLSLDEDGVDSMSISDWDGLYREKLRERDEFCRIKPDGRLWQGD